MRAVIVSAKLISDLDCWNAAYYMGGPETAKRVRNAEINLAVAKTRLKNAQAALLAEQERVNKMIEDGLVTVID